MWQRLNSSYRETVKLKIRNFKMENQRYLRNSLEVILSSCTHSTLYTPRSKYWQDNFYFYSKICQYIFYLFICKGKCLPRGGEGVLRCIGFPSWNNIIKDLSYNVFTILYNIYRYNLCITALCKYKEFACVFP